MPARPLAIVRNVRATENLLIPSRVRIVRLCLIGIPLGRTDVSQPAAGRDVAGGEIP
jgi:hypothetical protein